jgi:hypothetical protein
MTSQVTEDDVSKDDHDGLIQNPVRFIICHTKKPDPHSVPCRNCLIVNGAPRKKKNTV